LSGRSLLEANKLFGEYAVGLPGRTVRAVAGGNWEVCNIEQSVVGWWHTLRSGSIREDATSHRHHPKFEWAPVLDPRMENPPE
jgi:hypothetical protein